MGRKPLKIDIIRPLLLFAKDSGERGFTRRDVIDNEVIPENRWATIKNRGLRAGWFVKRGYKKSARYYIAGCEPNNDDELFEEVAEEVEDDDTDPDSLFDELDNQAFEPSSEPPKITANENEEVDWDFDF